MGNRDQPTGHTFLAGMKREALKTPEQPKKGSEGFGGLEAIGVTVTST